MTTGSSFTWAIHETAGKGTPWWLTRRTSSLRSGWTPRALPHQQAACGQALHAHCAQYHELRSDHRRFRGVPASVDDSRRTGAFHRPKFQLIEHEIRPGRARLLPSTAAVPEVNYTLSLFSGVPVANCEPGLRAFLHDSEISSDFSFADHPRVGFAGFPRFRPPVPAHHCIRCG